MMQSDHGLASSFQPTSSNRMTPDQKILQDLATLSEKITLCQSMLNQERPPSSVDTNEALLTVIGFLEACVPRMVELIEGAAQGALREETLEECLLVNDNLLNVLADVEKDPKDRRPMLSVAAASSSMNPSELDSADLLAIGGIENLNVRGEQTVGGETAGLKSEYDPFSGELDLLGPSSEANGSFSILGDTPDPITNVKTDSNLYNDDDDFDEFFKDRTSAPSGAKQG